MVLRNIMLKGILFQIREKLILLENKNSINFQENAFATNSSIQANRITCEMHYPLDLEYFYIKMNNHF